ncbi:MAG TPA: imidazole glycerol phosphate synthase subunit HisH [Nitrospiria bacterium]|nr:imidazole glycerol phosphate synthase subunit HisH [Nitrospiria bacterium]
MIAIIDYGMGNLRSVQKGFEQLGLARRWFYKLKEAFGFVGHKAVITRDKKVIANADKIVLPGVGAFPDCMKNLDDLGLIEPIIKGIRSGKPFLGICLGMQLLFTESDEFGIHKGLDLIKGRVIKFPEGLSSNGTRLKIPHMGWNGIRMKKKTPVLDGIPDGSYLYFVHSYYVVPEDKEIIATTTDYGGEFVSSIWKDNIFACQFHPEKSQKAGLDILKNFRSLK